MYKNFWDGMYVSIVIKNAYLYARRSSTRLITTKSCVWAPLRQCLGENSIFFNNRTNELLFGRRHCGCDVSTKTAHFHTLNKRLLWKPEKIAEILDSLRKSKRSEFLIFWNQILYLNFKKQYLRTDQSFFWYFEKKIKALFWKKIT